MLAAGAPADLLMRAAAANQTAWMERTAKAAGGAAHRERGVRWMVSPAGAVLAFPRLSSERLAGLLPRFLAAARAGRVGEASCWSLLPSRPADLDDQLRRAGFRGGWQAHWMAVETERAGADDAPAGVEIALAPLTWKESDLPYDGAGIADVRRRLADARPRRTWHLGARRDGRQVGHALVNVTTGPLGVAGIFDMGVAVAERRKGIGRALVAAALRRAHAEGCAVATLNATPEGELLYRQLGFASVGVAQTWWLDVESI
jgi:GNAT superfamily N-acetyltransferase